MNSKINKFYNVDSLELMISTINNFQYGIRISYRFLILLIKFLHNFNDVTFLKGIIKNIIISFERNLVSLYYYVNNIIDLYFIEDNSVKSLIIEIFPFIFEFIIYNSKIFYISDYTQKNGSMPVNNKIDMY